MKEKTYLVYLADRLGGRLTLAASVKIYSEHLVVPDPSGALLTLFLWELVDHWADSDK